MHNRVRQQLGHYRLIRLLGRTALADVYLAQPNFLNTQVVIKVLQVELLEDELENFLNVAGNLTNLVHPHIVRVLEVGKEAGLDSAFPFLVMEYAPKGTLRQRHPIGSRLPLTTILPYVRQIAGALHHAHLQKLVHCDVNPESLLVGSNNQLLLSDFSTGLLSLLTETAIGRVAYMAPELIQGKPCPSSDEYALGVMVYEWLSGELPFSGSLREIANQHLSASPPPLHTKSSEISPAVEEVVSTALAKEPGRRFENLLAFANALERAGSPEKQYPPASLASTVPPVGDAAQKAPSLTRYVPGPSIASHSSAPHSSPQALVNLQFASKIPHLSTRPISRRAIIVGLPVLAVAGGSMFAWFLNQGGSSITSAQSSTLLTYHGHAGAVTAVAWSPDGRYIASGGDDHTIHVWQAKMGADAFVFHGHSGGVPAVTWSPDSTRIASASAGPSVSGGSPAEGNTVQVWYAISGKPIYSYHGHTNGITNIAWAPKDERIASASTDYTVQVWQATTGKSLLNYHTHPWYVWTVAWSPDGTRIASGGPDGTIQIWNAVTGNTLATFQGHESSVEAISWSPDSTRIASASDDKTVRIWDAISGTRVYTYLGHTNYVHAVSWSPDGYSIASGSSDKTVQIWNATTGRTIYTYRGHSAAVTAVVWSPNSKYLASGSEDSTAQVWQAS